MSTGNASLEYLIEVFDKAADYIDTHGWWNPAQPDSFDETERERSCIGNAIERVTRADANDKRVAAQDALLNHFEFTELQQVFDLNDTQPLDGGKEWAVSNLRQIAEQLKASKRDGAVI